MCDLIAISSLPGNCFSTFSLIILTLGLGSSHVSKQNPWKIPSFPVSSASDPNCLWNNLWMLWHRLWGPAWVNTWFGHSPAWDLGASQPLPALFLDTWLPSHPFSVHVHASLPWRASLVLSLHGKTSTVHVNHAASMRHLLCTSHKGNMEPWLTQVRTSGSLWLAWETGWKGRRCK